MHTEVSVGVIPILYSDDSLEQPSVCVLKHKNGLHWGFPKGHPLDNETQQETAFRELYEESGLRPDKLLSEQPLVQRYSYVRDTIVYNKQVFYFIATVSGKLSLQAEEIVEGKWVSFKEAISLLSFDNSKEIACQAARFLGVVL